MEPKRIAPFPLPCKFSIVNYLYKMAMPCCNNTAAWNALSQRTRLRAKLILWFVELHEQVHFMKGRLSVSKEKILDYIRRVLSYIYNYVVLLVKIGLLSFVFSLERAQIFEVKSKRAVVFGIKAKNRNGSSPIIRVKWIKIDIKFDSFANGWVL